MAPWIRSSHMNQNRCWPGVPNRYRTRSLSSVIRPKSIATVVVDLSGTCDRSSTSVLATVITASVVSGVISDTEPTNVVLPTPNPPATTILTDVMAGASVLGWATLDLTESTEHPFEQMEVWTSLRVVALVYPDETVSAHVGDEDPGHAERQPQHRRHLGDRPPVPAELQDRLALRGEHGQVARLEDGRGDQRLDGELVPGLRPASGHRIRPDQLGAALVVGRHAEAGSSRPLLPQVGGAGSSAPGPGQARERRPVVTSPLTSH